MGVGWPEISTAFFCANYGTMIWEILSCGGIYLFNILQARRHLDQGLVMKAIRAYLEMGYPQCMAILIAKMMMNRDKQFRGYPVFSQIHIL